MSQSGWDSLNHSGRGRTRTRLENPKGRRTSTPVPSNEASPAEDFDDELTEFTYHFWLKALQREDRRQRKYVKSKRRHNPANAALSSSSSLQPATTTSSSVSSPYFLVNNAAVQPTFVPYLPVSSHYVMSHTYSPLENPASLVCIRPSPLYLPPPNTVLYCYPLFGYYQNGAVGIIPYAYNCFYM